MSRAAFLLLTVVLASCSQAWGGGYYGPPDTAPIGPDGKRSSSVVTEFNEMVTARRIVDVYSNPSWGTSIRRDDIDITGAGSVTSADGELSLAVTAAAGETIVLETVDRASYIPGNQGQVGIGIRIPTLPVDDQEVRWGLFSADNGFGWGHDATGPFIFYRTNGTETLVRQGSWNLDQLDGTGPSKVNIDFTDGHIYEVDFVWYGYGTLSWGVLAGRQENAQRTQSVHVYNPNGSTSVEDPNQPIRVEITNGATGGAFDVRVGGRQFSLYRGARTAQVRDLQEVVYGTTLAANPTWTPLICIRRKATVNGRTNSIRTHFRGFRVLSSSDMEMRVTFADTVTGGTWGTPTGVTASETGIETNTTMSSVTAGDVIHRGFLAAAVGTARGVTNDEERDDFPRDEPMCMWGRPFAGTPSIDAAMISWEEEW